MSKKTKQRAPQHRASLPSPPPPALFAPLADGPIDAVEARELDRLSGLADEVAKSQTLEDVLEPGPITPGLTVSIALRHADDARRKMEAAQRKFERLQGDAAVERSALAASRKDLEGEQATQRGKEADLDQRERSLVEREAAIDAREQDAEVGFLALRRATMQPLEEERSRLREELARIRAQAISDRQRIDEELQSRLDTIEASARQGATERQLAVEAERSKLRLELQNEREKALLAARIEAARIVSSTAAESESRSAVLDEREMGLREREAQIGKLRRDAKAEREILDEDKQDFEARVERAVGRAVTDVREQIATLTAERDSARAARDAREQRIAACDELERQIGGRGASDVLAELKEARSRAVDLSQRLLEMPSAEAREQARADVKLLQEARDANRSLLAEIASLKSRLAQREIAVVEVENIRAQKEAFETRSALLGTELSRLRAEYGELTKEDEAKHPLASLVELDERHASPGDARSLDAGVTLVTFVTDLQQRLVRAIPERELHYSLRDVRSFLGGMAMSRLMLLQGISGTGKTSLPVAVANSLGGDHVIIEVQAGWRDRQDLLGFYNAFHKRFYATEFLQALYRAGSPEFANRVSIIVLDEINLSRVEQFFADFLSVLEKPEGDQVITLMDQRVSSPPALFRGGKYLPLPKNVWFVGTANHDETTTAFADKTYDRAHVMELPRHTAMTAVPRPPKARPPVRIEDLNALFASAARENEGAAKKVNDWFSDPAGIAGLLEREFRLSWGNRLQRDIERYVPVIVSAGGSVGEATDHLLTTKVLRRLRDRYDVRAEGLQRVKQYLETSWIEAGSNLSGEARPSRSLALIDGEIRARQSGATA